MAFTRGQVDRFGRPIPASPGYQILINADGSEVRQRNRLILPAGLVASDSEDSDASSLELEALTPGDLAPIAARTVIGNNSASTAVPTAEPATAIGFGVLAAATQAALTALIALATNTLAGLMSAAQFLKLDAQADIIHSAAYVSVTSVTTASFTAGTYRRIELHCKNSAGATTSINVSLVGAAAASYHFKGLTLSGGVAVNGAAQDSWIFTVSGGGGDFSAVDAWIQLLGYKTMTGSAVENTSDGRTMVGICTDQVNPITGVTVTFSTASTGYLEIRGYK